MRLLAHEGKDLLVESGVAVDADERLAVAAEYRLALAVDRDRRCLAVSAARRVGGATLRQEIDPLLGLQPFATARLARHLSLPEASVAEFATLLEALHALAFREDAIAITLDPLVLTEAGRLVAAGAAVVIDDMALYRHPRWAGRQPIDDYTPLERALRGVGAIAAETDPRGSIIAVVSGAGLMMSALDMLTLVKAPVRCVVDMQGLPLQGVEAMLPLCRIIAATEPGIIVIGGRFQAPVGDLFASAIAEALVRSASEARKIGWIAGNRAAEACAVLAAAGFEVAQDFPGALAATLRRQG